MKQNRQVARLAGLSFLILVITGVFSEFFVRQKIFVTNDPAATAQNILTSENLFRMGIVSDLVMSTLFLFFSLLLYIIFKPVNERHARLMLFSTTVAVVILCVNMLNQIAALLLVSGAAGYLSSFTVDQINGLVTFFLKMHTNGYLIAQIFYGLYLFPLGYLIIKSHLVPKIIGVFLILGCIGDQIDVIRFFIFPDHESIILQNITLPANIGEFSLCLWLLIMGVKETKAITVADQVLPMKLPNLKST